LEVLKMKKKIIYPLLVLYSCATLNTKLEEEKVNIPKICSNVYNQKIEVVSSPEYKEKHYIVLLDNKITYTMSSKIGDISTTFYPLEERIRLHGKSIVRGYWSKESIGKEDYNYKKELEFFIERIEDELDSTHQDLKECILKYKE
jgi:hypothetical protein